MNLRKTTIAAVVCSAMLPGIAAANVTIDGITFATGSIFSTVTLWEGNAVTGAALTAVGDKLLVIGQVDAIKKGATNTWVAGQNGRELTFIASGLEVSSISGTNEFLFKETSPGSAKVQIFSDTTIDLNPTTIATALATAGNGTLWLDLLFQPMGGFGGAVLQAQQAGTLVTGEGFLDVMGGSAGGNFNTNFYNSTNSLGLLTGTDNADIFFSSQGRLLDPNNPFPQFDFFGSGTIATAPIPEPGTLALLGLGLGLVGSLSRRRK